MRALLSWLIVGLGVGTVTAIIKYIAVWYFMRRFRRMFRRKKRADQSPVAPRQAAD